MFNPILSLLNNPKQLNVICAATHERVESNFANLDVDFWAFKKTGVFKPGWNTKFAPIPDNYHLLDERRGDSQIYPWISPDVCLSQNKFGQFQILSQIAKAYNIPLISWEHTSRMEWWTSQQLKELHNMRGNINIFIAESQIEDWGWEDKNDTYVIRHAINTDLFAPDINIERKKYILTVSNDYIGRDNVLNFSQFKRIIIDNRLPFRAVGETKGFSEAPPDVQSLVKEYQNSQIFVNTHHVSPIPMSLLEAMACGCCVVSCNKNEIPYYIKHKENGLLYNNDEEMSKYLHLALNDKEMCQELGKNARETIIKECNIERYIRELSNIFELARRLK